MLSLSVLTGARAIRSPSSSKRRLSLPQRDVTECKVNQVLKVFKAREGGALRASIRLSSNAASSFREGQWELYYADAWLNLVRTVCLNLNPDLFLQFPVLASPIVLEARIVLPLSSDVPCIFIVYILRIFSV